jgi:hypothetical protein
LAEQLVKVSFFQLQRRKLFGVAVFAVANSPMGDSPILIAKYGQSDADPGFVLIATSLLCDPVAGGAEVSQCLSHDSPRLD